MDIVKIRSSEIFSNQKQFHFAFITELSATTTVHTHDFYEIFIILEGQLLHAVNDYVVTAGVGTITLIRPDDRHFFQKINGSSFMFVNIAFSSEVASDTFNFFDYNFMSNLLKQQQPPSIQVSSTMYLK